MSNVVIVRYILKKRSSGGIDWRWHLYCDDGGGRNKTILHMLCILDGLLDIFGEGVKMVDFFLDLFPSHEWDWSSLVIYHSKRLSRDEVLLRCLVKGWWRYCESKSGVKCGGLVVLGILLGGFWVKELAVKAIECEEDVDLDELEGVGVGVGSHGDVKMLNKSSEKHSIEKSHIDALGHTNHSIDHVVGKIKFRNDHLEGVEGNINSFDLASFARRSRIKEGITNKQRIFKRLQKLVSQLELLGEKISQEDVNQKLLRSLSPEWNTHVVVWRNKADMDTMIIDDLYNNFKVYEPEVKEISSSNSNTHNMVFLSFTNSSTNGALNTAQVVNIANGVSISNTQVNAAFSVNIEKLSDSDQTEEGPNYALMTYTSSTSDLKVSNDSTCSKTCLDTVKLLKAENEQLLKDFKKSELMVFAYKTGLKSVEERIAFFKKNEFIYLEDIEVLKVEMQMKEIDNKELRRKLDVAQKEKDGIQLKAARTMLADSKLPATFWTEAVNTACYAQNRVLVVKPHNKTPYELFHGRTPTLSFMRPFRCPVTILNTKDHLGKFDGKADEGFFAGYSLNSKAFRVFNSRTRIMEEDLHIRFSENSPNVVGSGLDWLFDIDALTRTMNYEQLLQTADLLFSQDLMSSQDNGFKPSSDDEKKVDEDPNNELLFDLNMHALEDIGTFDFLNEDEDDDAVVDMNNLDTTIQVSPTPTIRIHKDHPLDQVIEDLYSATQTRNMTKNLEERGFVSTKWVFKNKKDERRIVIRNKARLVAQGHTQEEGIDYDEVFAHVARIKAIRLFLAYASFKDFVVYQMNVKSDFLYEKIEEEVYVCQPPGFEDLDFPDRVYKVKKALYGLHQAPKACQDKYVAEIIKKFGFSKVKNASTPMETQKPLPKDEDGEEVDVHMYISMISTLMYLTSSRPDIMFTVCACARYQVNLKVSHLHAVKRIFRYIKGQPKLGLWYLKDSPFDLVAYTNSDYVGASLDRKSTT
nr:hypothetical protein [Tanacetum cinerariifolium]